MTEKQKTDYLKSHTTPEEYKNLLLAAKHATSDMATNGFSISAARDEYNKVRSHLAFLLCHDDKIVRGTAENIMKAAEENTSKGLFDYEGKQMFLID